MPRTAPEITMPFSSTASPRSVLRTRFLALDAISAADRQRWHDLAARTCHWNPFQLPEFVLPSGRYLADGRPLAILVVDDPVTDQWMAVMAVQPHHCRWDLPLSHAAALRTRHTFRTGPLVDGERVAETLDCLLGSLSQHPGARHGLELPLLRLDSILARELQAAARRGGYGWHVSDELPCPAVFPQIVTAEYLDRAWSASRRKTIRRAYKKLEALGPVQLRLIRDPAEIPSALGRFLELEQKSWKGTANTALASTPADHAFVQEMVAGMAARGHVVMTELRAGDRLAAAAINLVLGETLCAFKIGWEIELAEASPGLVHEVELLRQADGPLAGYTLLDGCTSRKSYLSHLWPEEIHVGTVVISTSTLARMGKCLAAAGRYVKSWRRS